MSSFQQRNDDVHIVYIQPRYEVTDPSQRKTRRESYYLSTLIASRFCIGLGYNSIRYFYAPILLIFYFILCYTLGRLAIELEWCLFVYYNALSIAGIVNE